MAETVIVCIGDQVEYGQLPPGIRGTSRLADAKDLIRRTFSLAEEDDFTLMDMSHNQSITSDDSLAAHLAAASDTDFPLSVKVIFNSGGPLESAIERKTVEAEVEPEIEPEIAEPVEKIAESETDESETDESETDESAPTTSDDTTHWCDNCKVRMGGSADIIRYQCANCPFFDLCEDCEVYSSTLHDETHVFYKHKRNCAVFTQEMPPLPSFNDFEAWAKLKKLIERAEANESADPSVYERLAEAESQLEALTDHLSKLDLLPPALSKADEDIEDLRYICLKVEVGISWASVTEAFRDRREDWVADVKLAKTAEPLVKLMREFVTFLAPSLTNETFLKKIESISCDDSLVTPKKTLCSIVFTLEKYLSAMGAIKDRPQQFHAILDRILN